MLDLAALDDLPVLSVLAITTLLHELGIPLPLSPAALLVGARVAAGAVDPVLPIAAIVAATLIGNAVWFAAGRRYGFEVLRFLGPRQFIVDMRAHRGIGRFEKWDLWLLVFGRFVPGLSLVAPPLAGALGMRWSRFLSLTAAGALLYGIVVVGAGMILHHQIESILSLLEGFGAFALAAVAIALTIYLTWQWRRRSLRDDVGRVEGIGGADRAAIRELRPHAPQPEGNPVALASIGVPLTSPALTRATSDRPQAPQRIESISRWTRTRQLYRSLSVQLLGAIRQPPAAFAQSTATTS
jgi:membrane protein DedA with SNARE-associated domain